MGWQPDRDGAVPALFIGMTLLFLGLALASSIWCRRSARPARRALIRARQRQRLTFWIVTVLLLGLLAVPWFAHCSTEGDSPCANC